MKKREYLFTSESVSEGHPDKIADYISDKILDSFLAIDQDSRVAMETLVTSNRVILAGEVRVDSSQHPNLEEVVIQSVKDLNYIQEGFHWNTLDIQNFVHDQSTEIAIGVDEGINKQEGAGDQGMMFGYACSETDRYMPAPIFYSHKILKALADKRKQGLIKGLFPDAKSQVTFKYENGNPIKIEKVVVSHQHEESLDNDDIKNLIVPTLKEVLPSNLYQYNEETTFINPTGKFVIGGPDGDTGLTGRKIIVDTYGGAAPHGGGAFSGKDPTKVDRSAAYMARYIAKNMVASGLCSKCTLQVSYVIGRHFPLSLYVDFHGTGVIPEIQAEEFILQNIDLSPKGIRLYLKLNQVIYAPTSSYGHFGRTPKENQFTWERLDLVDFIKDHFKL